jgi:hypothetical protein
MFIIELLAMYRYMYLAGVYKPRRGGISFFHLAQ